jgi:hypothetical protein
MKTSEAGDRWERLLEVCKDAIDSSALDEQSRSFAEDMASRLASYEQRTYVSVRQLNWINRIEAEMDDWDRGTVGRE